MTTDQVVNKKHDFFWGAATSAHQVEGNNQHNDWWNWEKDGNIEGGVVSGKASNHFERYKEDIQLAAKLGLNSYRFSIEWSRIEPEQGKWNEQAIHWYKKLILECEKNKILPMVTLHHFTSPRWFSDKGGFSTRESPNEFLCFVEKIIESIGAHVPIWCTFNEPMVLVVGGYIGKFMPPAVFEPKKAITVIRNIIKAHVFAYDLIHSDKQKKKGPWRDHKTQVGFAHNMIDFLPDRKFNPVEKLIVYYANRFYNIAFLESLNGEQPKFGVPGIVPNMKPVKQALERKTLDFIGLNYYTKAYIRIFPNSTYPAEFTRPPLAVAFSRNKEKKSDLGWAIHPKGMYKMLKFLSKYHLPIYITENGIADKRDNLRSEYLMAHLHQVAKSIDEGVDIRGYYHWSLIDNFEWIKGFWPRFGLFHVDYDTYKRTPRKSAKLYKKIIEKSNYQRPSLKNF